MGPARRCGCAIARGRRRSDACAHGPALSALGRARPAARRDAGDAAISALLAGEALGLEEIVLDLGGVSEFHCKVYAIARRIPPGQVRTYGDIAAELGDKGLARAVGQALGHNPFAPVVPCHRVLGAGSASGGFSAHGGAAAKLRMLAIEGAQRPGDSLSLF